MPLGPGVYDDICTEVREKTQAVAVLVAIIEGNRGTGFAVQAPLDITLRLPNILRSMADEIEKSGEPRIPE